MSRQRFFIAVLGWLACHSFASAQIPQVLYTFNGTGDIREWDHTQTANTTVLTNNIAGELTVTEMGDPEDPLLTGGAHVFYDGHNRRYESSTDQGGLDVTGLQYIEIDVGHNSPTATVNVQFFLQATPGYAYLWGGSDGTLGGPDWAIGPGMHTIRFPINLLTPAQQAYIRPFGISVRDHSSVGNLTWTVSEARTLGTPLTVRTLASHDIGTSDNGLQGAIANFDIAAIQGNNGGQNQSGLSQNTSGSGSLQWTDLGGGPGAAISWGNGTTYDGNTFNERLLSAPQYNFVIYRMSATGTGTAPIGVQQWFQTGNYNFQVAGASGFSFPLPNDGQYHDFAFPIANVTNKDNIQQFGINLFSHPDNAVINVDQVQFLNFAGLAGDYNNNGVVDAGDYVLARKYLNTSTTLPNDVTPGQVTQEDFIIWRYFFGKTPGSGSSLGSEGVPEPSALFLLLCAGSSQFLSRGRRGLAAVDR
jgi:hypothetical protein